MLEAFALGLASGTACLVYCAPVLVPYLLGEGKDIRRNVLLLAQFLLGRLAGYVLFALLAWGVGLQVAPGTQWREVGFGLTYVVLAVFLVVYGFTNAGAWCAGPRAPRFLQGLASRWPAVLPVVLGFLTGVNLCPPFLLALTRAAGSSSALQSVYFFIFFFLGTLVYFLPMPLVGAFRFFGAMRTIGRLASGIIGIYYFYVGLLTLYGGIVKP